MKWATGAAFHNRYTGGMRDLIAFRSDHAIQGWYMTTNGGAIVLNNDMPLVRSTFCPFGRVMLTLSVVQSPDHRDSLPSILDLMSSSCGTREMPITITAGDLAFLKALCYKNTGLGPSLSRAEIESNIMRQFELR